MWLGAITLCLLAIWKVSHYPSEIDHFHLKKQLEDIYKKKKNLKEKRKQATLKQGP